MDIHSVCDYLITAARKTGGTLNVLKLQKLMYYAQSWHMAFQGEPLFRGKFQAWPQGPVNREIYDRFAGSKSLESELFDCDVSRDFTAAQISQDKRLHLDRVLQAYGKYQEPELQEMIAREAPWQEAKGHGAERCEREIDEDNMRRYCTVLYLVGLHESNPVAPFTSPGFHLPVGPDTASACNWLARESNSAFAGRNPS